MLSTLAIVLFYLIMGLPASLIGLPWTLLRRDITFLYKWAMWIANTGLKLGGIRIDVRGREQILNALQVAWGGRLHLGAPLRRFAHKVPGLTTNLGPGATATQHATAPAAKPHS